MGWSGMQSLLDRVERTALANGLVEGMLEVRDAGKAFIITGAQGHVGKVAEGISALKEEARRGSTLYQSGVNRKRMEDANDEFGKYGDLFKRYA